MPAKSSLKVNTRFDAQPGTPVPVRDGIVRITAPNASPYTFTGTNSFLIGTGDDIAILDPGPADEMHFKALNEAVGSRHVKAIILTHTHKDHSALAARLAAHTGAPLWFGGQHRLSRPRKFLEVNRIAKSCDWDLIPDRHLMDGHHLVFGDITLEVVETPGHCANHLAFVIQGSDTLFSGDHVMGWNSTLVSVPDGSMTDYFNSLDKLLALDQKRYLPAHGDEIKNAKSYTRQLRNHRLMRNKQILTALEDGPKPITALRERMYPDLPLQNRGAALMTLQAHVEFLVDAGMIAPKGLPWQQKFQLVGERNAPAA